MLDQHCPVVAEFQFHSYGQDWVEENLKCFELIFNGLHFYLVIGSMLQTESSSTSEVKMLACKFQSDLDVDLDIKVAFLSLVILMNEKR